jgi:hypothetical protein
MGYSALLRSDDKWTDYREDPRYYETLTAAAWGWHNIYKMYVQKPSAFGTIAKLAVIARLQKEMVQHPMEFDDVNARYDRSRWRLAVLVPPGPFSGLHCEHAWAKRRTKQILTSAVPMAIQHGIHPHVIEQAIADILDARQDTVLLATQRTGDLGIKPDRTHDGLGARYADAIRSGRIELVDRLTKKVLTADDALQISQESESKVTEALARLGF